MNPITPSIAGCLICSFNSMKAVEEASRASYTEDRTIYEVYSEYTDGKKHIGLRITESRPLERVVVFDVDDVDGISKLVSENKEYLQAVMANAVLTLNIEKKV